MSRRRRGRVGGRLLDEGGAVLAVTALLLPVLLAFVGFTVDFWNRSRASSQMQKAADAAALAGAVFMPENAGNVAFTTSRRIATKNGFTTGVANTTVTVAAGALATQIEVTITRTVSNFFGAFVGVSTTTITRHAVAEFERHVNLGSPINQFGNNPEASPVVHGSQSYPDFWANVFGPRSQKQKGDAVLGQLCNASPTPDNCFGGTSADYSAQGYFYGIEVQPGTSNPLTVQAFDPEFAHVGDNCGNNDSGSNLVGAAGLAVNFNPSFSVSNPSVRYAPVATSPFCTGDMYYTSAGESGGPPWTTYQLRAPDDTPADPSDNPVVCGAEFPGYQGDLRTALLATTPQAGAPDLFVKYFRQWYTLCTVSTPEAGLYYLQVQTATKLSGAAASDGSGANRFAIRAGLAGSYTNSNLRVFGNSRIGIYANSPAANTTFYLARVLPGANGRHLVISFFDTGDAAAAGTLTVLPPPDSNVGASFSGCTYTAPPGYATGPPWGAFQATASGCRVTNVSSTNYNGQWIQFKVPIPDGYTCTYTAGTGCWFRLNFAFPDAVQDTTTWMAQIEGDPVRLVE